VRKPRAKELAVKNKHIKGSEKSERKGGRLIMLFDIHNRGPGDFLKYCIDLSPKWMKTKKRRPKRAILGESNNRK